MPKNCDVITQAGTAFTRASEANNSQVATTRTARSINRRIVLNLIRKHQPISRADLSRRSRLQRSTVSAITEQLIAERWVTTGAGGDLPRGRKPSYLHLNGDRTGVIGVDVRPLETSVVLSDLDMRFLTQESMPTARDPNRFMAQLCERLVKMLAAYPHLCVEGIGVALPGRIELATGRLAFAPNMGWGPIDLKQPIEQATGLPVELENAANACALAEIWGGLQPDNIRDLIAVTVSEGIGVGMILNGQLVRGTTGAAGEFGHVTIQEDGPLCQCGNRGCFEVCASNTAAVRYYCESAFGPGHARPEAAPRFESILELAEQGDRHALKALDRMARALGAGLAMIITGLAPDVIVVIGEVTRAWATVDPTVQEVVRSRLPTGAKTRIVPGASATQSRLRGTVALVLQKHFGALDL